MNTSRYIQDQLGTARGERGSTMLYMIMMMVMMGALLASMVTLFDSAAKTSVQVDNHREAYYMAESGLRYSMTMLNDPTYGTSMHTRLNRLNNVDIFTVDSGSGQAFDVSAYVLGQLIAVGDQHASGGDELVMKRPGNQSFASNFTLPIAGDSAGDPYLVSAAELYEDPNDQELVRITAVRISADGMYLYLTVQDSTKVTDGQEMFLATQAITGNQSITEGGNLTIQYAGAMFPPKNGIVTIMGETYQYEELLDNGNGTWTLSNLRAPNNGLWGTRSQSNIGNGNFVILNSTQYKNVYFYVTGFAGVGSVQSVQDTFALGDYVYLYDQVDNSTEHPHYIVDTGDFPEETELYGDPLDDTAYQGATAPDGTELEASNLASLSYNTAAGNYLIFVGRYGDENVHDSGTMPSVFYKDLDGPTGYELGIRLSDDGDGEEDVVSTTDYTFVNDGWVDFEVSYNVEVNAGISDEAFLRVVTDQATGHYAEIADLGVDPDHMISPVTFPEPSGKDRYISNFFILADGLIVNSNKEFITSIRNIQIYVNGEPWPGTDGWTANSYYDATPDYEDFIIRDNRVWRCSTSGTSGATEPDWTTVTSYGQTITDGTAVWTWGLPGFQSTADEAAYLLTQFDDGATSVKITGQYSMYWNWNQVSPIKDFGLRIYFLLHDVDEPTP